LGVLALYKAAVNLMADFPDLVTIYTPAHLPAGFYSQIHLGIPRKEYITDISLAKKCRVFKGMGHEINIF
jgi:hypothetical protein